MPTSFSQTELDRLDAKFPVGSKVLVHGDGFTVIPNSERTDMSLAGRCQGRVVSFDLGQYWIAVRSEHGSTHGKRADAVVRVGQREVDAADKQFPVGTTVQVARTHGSIDRPRKVIENRGFRSCAASGGAFWWGDRVALYTADLDGSNVYHSDLARVSPDPIEEKLAAARAQFPLGALVTAPSVFGGGNVDKFTVIRNVDRDGGIGRSLPEGCASWNKFSGRVEIALRNTMTGKTSGRDAETLTVSPALNFVQADYIGFVQQATPYTPAQIAEIQKEAKAEGRREGIAAARNLARTQRDRAVKAERERTRDGLAAERERGKREGRAEAQAAMRKALDAAQDTSGWPGR